MNAKEEFLEKIEENSLQVKCAMITFDPPSKSDKFVEQLHILLNIGYSSKDFNDFLNKLDFEYDNGIGFQNLYGRVWFTDDTWMDRDECNGAEWWVHRKMPTIPEELKYKIKIKKRRKL